jgi:hypothetical protein
LNAEEELVKYGKAERRILEIGLQAGIPYEELRDWYCELLLGEIDITELVHMVGQRAKDRASRELVAEIKSFAPRVVLNG